MTTKINFNGILQDRVLISALDHGFLFGDSVYEVLCTYNSKPCFLNLHLNRLRNSASAIYLDIPWDDNRFREEIDKTIQLANNKDSYIRIVVTRGEGEIDIDPATCKQPNVLIYVKSAKIYPIEDYFGGIHVALVNVKRNSKEALNPEIKTGNYLNNVLAKMEAIRIGANDALMLNNWGKIAEGTTSNFFWIRDGRIRTPSLECGILSGITREIIIELAKKNGIIVEEGEWEKEELVGIDEAFLTGTIKRIMPVSRLNGIVIGSGKPGSITRKLMSLYETNLENNSGESFFNK